jgi:hypothetical protein
MVVFQELLLGAADEMQCVNPQGAIGSAHDLAVKRAEMAKRLLLALGMPKTAAKIEIPDPPSRPWLDDQCGPMGLRTVAPQSLEIVRQRFTSEQIFDEWFRRYGWLLERDPRAIGNFDETHCDSRKNFRVIAPKKRMPIVVEQLKPPHVTAMVTILSLGFRLPIFYVLAGLRSLKGLASLEGSAYFASSASGWMNKDLFTVFAFILIAELTAVQHRIPVERRIQRWVMTSDGHGSRLNFRAMWLFDHYGVDVVLLLAHTSHAFQPLDTSINGPAKAQLKREFIRQMPRLRELDPAARGKAAMMRQIVVEGFESAMDHAASRSNIASAFRKTGMVPVNPKAVCDSQYVVSDDVDAATMEQAFSIPHHLTSPAGLEWLAQREYQCSAAEAAAMFDNNPHRIFDELMENCAGRVLSFIPGVIWRTIFEDETERDVVVDWGS